MNFNKFLKLVRLNFTVNFRNPRHNIGMLASVLYCMDIKRFSLSVIAEVMLPDGSLAAVLVQLPGLVLRGYGSFKEAISELCLGLLLLKKEY